jgi:hypothetical protein
MSKWETVLFGDVLDYEQPLRCMVNSTTVVMSSSDRARITLTDIK